MRVISYIIIIIVILLGLSFSLLNASLVELNYYIGSVRVSLSLLLILAVGIGILIGFAVALSALLKLKHRNRQLKNRIKQLEQEIIGCHS